MGGPRTDGTGPALEWTGGLCSPQDSCSVHLQVGLGKPVLIKQALPLARSATAAYRQPEADQRIENRLSSAHAGQLA